MEVHDLSFNPRDPLYDAPGFPGVRWGIQVFTIVNLYGLDPDEVEMTPEGDGVRLVCSGLSWAGGQKRARGRVEARLSWQDGALSWGIQAWHDEPIKSVKLLLWGLPEDALAQGWWHPTVAEGEVVKPAYKAPVRWTYPQGWLTPWACAGEGEGALCLSVRDPQVREKRLYVHSPPYAEGKQVVELICEEDATAWDGRFETPQLRLRVCKRAGEIDADFEAHLSFVEGAYGLERWEERADVPAWARDIRLQLNLHGQHWTGYVFNTFDQMVDVLRFATRHIPGEQVLAYLPGWEGRYYFSYPHFKPGEDLGGDAGFRRLVSAARELGVRLLPMFGAHGANAQRYPDWERAAFRNSTDRYVTLFNQPDWDSDRAGEDDQVFLNPGEPNYRRHLVDEVSAAVERYGLEVVYFDTTAAWFNDPRYNLYEGYRTLLRELRARHPGLMVAGEGWTDALLALFPVNLSWLGVTRRYRYPQFLSRYGRALQHLNEGAPGLGSTGVYEGGFTPTRRIPPTPGHLPSVSIVDDTLAHHSDELARIFWMAAEREEVSGG